MKITARKLPNGDQRIQKTRRVFAGQLAHAGVSFRDGHYVIEAADGVKIMDVFLTPRETKELCAFHDTFRVARDRDN